MTMTPDGKRLQSVTFEKISKRGAGNPGGGITEFNYNQHQVNWIVWNGEKMAGEGYRDIPKIPSMMIPCVLFLTSVTVFMAQSNTVKPSM